MLRLPTVVPPSTDAQTTPAGDFLTPRRGRVAVVTGASSGIGRRVALDLAQEGAVVCVTARREERLRSLVDELPGSGHSYVVADLGDPASAGMISRHVAEAHGACHLLVNNAGFSRPGRFDEPGALEALEAVVGTNFFGAARLTAALLELLAASAPSAIVNVASVAGRLALRGGAAYCASKFALVGWSESLHFDLAPRRIHVGLVEPGPVPTEGFPQRELLGHPVFRFAVSTPERVSLAVREVADRRKLRRTVPRTYALLVAARYFAPPLYAGAQRWFIKDRLRRNTSSSG